MIFFILIPTIVIIIVISKLVSQGIQSPLLELKQTFQEFNAGKYDAIIKIKGNDEIADLTKSFQTFQEFFMTNDKIKSYYQKELEVKLDESANFKKALDESSNVSITDADGIILYVNDKFKEVSKYSENELIGQNHRILKSGFHSDDFYANMWQVISSGNIWYGDIKNRGKYGDEFWVKTTIIPFLGKDGKPVQYIAVRSDVTNQKQTESKLIDALKAIQKTDVLKNEFASMITHELKTPLTPIRGYCEMLKEDSLGKLTDEQLECISTIDSNASHLEQLIADILDAQKLDMGRMVFHKQSFPVGSFFTDLKKNLQTLMIPKQITLTINPMEEGTVFSDEQRLKQVFYNLVRNAIDFVDVYGLIEIGIATKGKDSFIFFVKDNGKGISVGKQKDLFKKFYQVDTTQTRRHGGTGLGLVICKGIVEGLGGKIWFVSKEGEGTSFYISIPKVISSEMEVIQDV
ncbi:MAG: ATP-binding protein [Nitrosopumilus sp.]